MRPLGAVAVAGVGMVNGRSDIEGSAEVSGRMGTSSFEDSSSSMAESIRAYPKYSPDLLAENIKYTLSAVCHRISSGASRPMSSLPGMLC